VFSNEDDNPFQRGILHALQLVALGLCAMILYEMAVSSALGIPQHMCIDGTNLQTAPPQ
jgi:hypothetical protein